MKKKNKDFEIEELVFRTFLKYIKADNLYTAFRLSINHTRGDKDIFHILTSRADKHGYNESIRLLIKCGGGAFSHSIKEEDVLHTLRAINHGKVLTVKNDERFQMAIMTMVNSLIHGTIEYALIKDMRRLEKLGSSIFDECCHKLLGDDFKDMTEEKLDGNQREFLDKLKEMYGDEHQLKHLGRDFWEQMHEAMLRELEERKSRERAQFTPWDFGPDEWEKDDDFWD